MIQLKLKLNSKKPTTVYAANGKTYQLNPGSNVLNLEYEDYLSLAKALGIKPVDNKKQEEPENKEKKEDNQSEKQEETENKEKKEDNPSEEQEEHENKEKKEDKSEVKKETENKEDQIEVKEEQEETENKEDKAEEQEELDNKEKKEDNPSEEQEVDLVNECVDYSAWSLKQLKSEYKKITGENCKLKKDDIISFLQERTSNA